MPADLAVDTAVTLDESVPGRYRIALPDHWDYLLPSGGALMTCALRAAEHAVGDPLLRLASATAMFCSPLHAAALHADVSVLRRGGATAQLHVALRHAAPPPRAPASPNEPLDDDESGDNVGLQLTATFVRDRRGPDVKAATYPPHARPLADALRVDDALPANPHSRFRFYHQLECRIADGEPFWVPGWSAGPARYARWLRYKAPQRDRAGRLDRLALPPLMDTMPTALHRALGPGPYRFFAPSLDLTTYFVDDTDREWLLVATTLRRARAGWGVADVEVWDDVGRFVAYGSQAMYLHNVAGDPPVVDTPR